VTVRVVLAVALAVALVAAAQPAIDHATHTSDDAALRANADRVADAVSALRRRSDPGETLTTAPRRTLRLDLPASATVAVESEPPRLVSQLQPGAEHTRPLPIRVVPCTDDWSLEGRVTLAYVESGTGPVVLVLRGFIRGEAATAAHACTPRAVRDGRP
jgi:hypothetical protein